MGVTLIWQLKDITLLINKSSESQEVVFMKRLSRQKSLFTKVDTGPMAPPSFGCGFPKIFPRSGIIIMKITISDSN